MITISIYNMTYCETIVHHYILLCISVSTNTCKTQTVLDLGELVHIIISYEKMAKTTKKQT